AKETTAKKRKANVANDVGTSGKVAGSVARKKPKKQDALEEIVSEIKASHASDVLDMPVDPNEPTYCLCHQVSYGEMIGCDNPDCPIEWFHFACVGLTNKPKGKWFCPKCNQERKKTKILGIALLFFFQSNNCSNNIITISMKIRKHQPEVSFVARGESALERQFLQHHNQRLCIH
uniref:PHD-type domain-containing protein n=1 Tax=Megaselia scalaris TaxID=36166 RepID=T1H1T4_MEGSC